MRKAAIGAMTLALLVASVGCRSASEPAVLDQPRGEVGSQDDSATASRPLDEDEVWQRAKENAAGAPLLRPSWLPEGFEIAAAYNGGSRDAPAPRESPAGLDVQYDREADTIHIKVIGLADDSGPFERVTVRGRKGLLCVYEGGVYVVWRESNDSETMHVVEGTGAVTSAEILRVAQSLTEY